MEYVTPNCFEKMFMPNFMCQQIEINIQSHGCNLEPMKENFEEDFRVFFFISPVFSNTFLFLTSSSSTAIDIAVFSLISFALISMSLFP